MALEGARIAVPAIPGETGIFSRLHQILKTAEGRRVTLTAQVQRELNLWRQLIFSLAKRPTHLRKIRPHPPTWTGAMKEYLKGMGRVCKNPSGQWFLWRPPIGETMTQRLLKKKNPIGDLTTNNLELAAYIAHLHIIYTLM